MPAIQHFAIHSHRGFGLSKERNLMKETKLLLVVSLSLIHFAIPASPAKADFLITSFDPPGSTGTAVFALNASGQTAGSYQIGTQNHGFIRNIDGTISTFDPLGSTDTFVYALSPSGKAAGYYDAGGHNHGFIRNMDGTFTAVDPSGGRDSIVYGINASGTSAGTYNACICLARPIQSGLVYRTLNPMAYSPAS
jgi:hypothetical protein